jgi:hypothetical protein
MTNTATNSGLYEGGKTPLLTLPVKERENTGPVQM